MITEIIFYVFAAITLVSAALVVFTRNIVHAAFALLFTFLGVAAFYVLLGADFLAATQVLIYVGGILVLILFGVMLTQRISSVKIFTFRTQVIPAGIGCTGLFLALLYVIHNASFSTAVNQQMKPTTRALGKLLMMDYLLPFEIASIVLLMALLGAVLIARKEVK